MLNPTGAPKQQTQADLIKARLEDLAATAETIKNKTYDLTTPPEKSKQAETAVEAGRFSSSVLDSIQNIQNTLDGALATLSSFI